MQNNYNSARNEFAKKLSQIGSNREIRLIFVIRTFFSVSQQERSANDPRPTPETPEKNCKIAKKVTSNRRHVFHLFIKILYYI